jgi:hypothetical protein
MPLPALARLYRPILAPSGAGPEARLRGKGAEPGVLATVNLYAPEGCHHALARPGRVDLRFPQMR